ncbi:MAG: flagellar biosynthesis protein FlhF [Lachnospiraceae bacterium]|nr:flagellar biosynthesis protein FlhF [Lachnospiraceae bacterium]
MTIKKFTGNSRDEAIQNAKNELGDSVVIMNVKEIRPKGVFGIFKTSTYEVTAALEDDKTPVKQNPSTALGEGGHFDAVAGERGVVNHVETKKNPLPPLTSAPSNQDADALAEESLRSAFKAVNDVIKKSESIEVNRHRNTENYANAEDKRLDSLLPNMNQEVKQPTNPAYQKAPKAVEKPEEDGFVNLKDSINADMEEKSKTTNRQFVSMLYNVLLSNEVDEKYVNQIIKDMEKVIRTGNNLDFLLSNVYQKLVLMMGKPKTIVCGDSKPFIVFLIGPTGVGKTTTIAKLASRYKLNYGKTVGLLTTDTYRIAATDQLRTYANILEIPLDVVLTKDDMNEAIAKMGGLDLILVDTAGFSHKNKGQRKDMEDILNAVDPAFQKDVYLVLSATTKYRDLKAIVDIYKSFTDFHLIFTKLDETDVCGNILNTKLYADTDISYVCNGQGVPDDIEVVNIQHIVKQLLGGK